MAYQLLWRRQTVKAIGLFKFNAEHFADSALAHNNLGDAYLENPQRGLALASFRRALLLLPEHVGLQGNVKAIED